jgi:hypothetical protein
MPSGRWAATRDALPDGAGGCRHPGGAHLGVSSPGRAMICRGGSACGWVGVVEPDRLLHHGSQGGVGLRQWEALDAVVAVGDGTRAETFFEAGEGLRRAGLVRW